MMSHLEQRKILVGWIREAQEAGARVRRACEVIGLSVRTVQRWLLERAVDGDRRAAGLHVRPEPANRLSEREREEVLQAANSDEYKNLPPSQIVPRLADQGVFLASESTFYRLLRQSGQMGHRRVERKPQERMKPRALVASQPDQVYCWDITYLPKDVRGHFFYLYLFVDLFSRKIVGCQVYENESADLASQVLRGICDRQGIQPGQLVVHSDNGAPMKGETMLTTMQRLGIAPSRSRPSTSNDNPYSESLFRTLKYRPDLPAGPFESLITARKWVNQLVHWYNNEHRHSAIGFVTPSQRHAGLDDAILKLRHAIYENARKKNPMRWSRRTRNWRRIDQVHLNPQKPKSESSTQTNQAA